MMPQLEQVLVLQVK